MGQKIGKYGLTAEAEPFSNLSRNAVTMLWRVFNDIADGFGISKEEMEEICVDLKDEINVSRLAIIEKAGALFDILDTDKNGLIDALELTSCIAALSGMRIREILEFILTSYDFDGTQQLSIDEVTLALKSTATGLCKLYGKRFPREDIIEQLVSELFQSISGSSGVKEATTTYRIGILAEQLTFHPDIVSWYTSFGEPVQTDIQVYNPFPQEIDYDQENPAPLVEGDSCDGHNQWVIQKKMATNAVLPIAPWTAVVPFLIPSAYTNTKINKFAPDVTPTLEWVYGYQSEKSKNNLRYTAAKGHCIVYPVGRYCVVYSFDLHSQSIFSGHRDEVLCLASHPEGELIATGESGPLPGLIVWSSFTMKICFMDKGFHRRGIAHVAFSLDGKQLAAVGLDVFHSVTVHLWQKSEVLYCSQVDKGKCLSCSFLSDASNTLAIGGDSYLYLWSNSSEGYVKRRANFSRHSTLQSITCIAPLEMKDSFVTGTVSGVLFQWTDRNCIRTVKGHQGSVTAIYSCTHGVITGGKDHRVRLWTQRLEPGATFDMSHFGLLPSIRSVCLSMDGSSILIGTLGAEIYEVSAVDGSDLRGGSVASGHFSGRLRSIAVHPNRAEFASVGDDKCLRVWDATTRTLLKIATFDVDAKSVCYSPLGDVIAVGLGNTSKTISHPKSGAFVILNEEDLSVIHEAKDSTTQIVLVIYSPEGETLAVAAEDGPIYLYAVNDEYELIGRCVRHSSPVVHIDFSIDGEWLRTNGLNGELLFFNSDDASLQSNSAAMRDMRWSTSSCIYSWHNKCIHDNNFIGETIITTCVSQSVMDNDTSGGTTSATPIPESSVYDFTVGGTDLGFLCFYPRPCIIHESEYHRVIAHTGPVASVRFLNDSQRMLSCGKFDRCLLQWRCVVNKPLSDPTDDLTDKVVAEAPAAVDYVESDDYGLEMRGGSDLEEDFMVPDCSIVSGILSNRYPMDDSVGTDDASVKSKSATTSYRSLSTLAESMQVWLESAVEPNNPPVQQLSAPDVTLELQYVHGYRCQDMRNNLRYTANDDITYVCATVGIVMNRLSKAQNYFQGHKQAISSFACSRDGTLVATGEIGFSPIVYVWDTTACMAVTKLPDLQTKSVIDLAFSNSGELLAVVGLDVDHTISIYNWRQSMLLCRGYGGGKRIMDICFSDNDLNFITCGLKEVKLWTLSTWACSSSVLKLNDGGRPQPFMTCVYFVGKPTVGTVDGHLYVFDDYAMHHAVKAHDGGVHAMHVSYSKTQLVTGGKDGVIRIWNIQLDCVKEILVENVLNSSSTISTRVRSVCFSKDGNFLLVGTRGADIFEIRISNSSLVGSKPLLQAHGCRDLWGLAAHPTKEEFMTSGDDCTIRQWDSKSMLPLKCIKMDSPSRAIAYSPDGKLVAVGFGSGGRRSRGKAGKDGAFVVLGAGELKLIHEGKDSNEAIRFVKFSADSKILAVGSEDARVYMYNVKDHYSRRCTISCHRAPLFSCDFSTDSKFLMSIDVTKRICYSDTTSGAHIPSAAALRDVKWATWSSPVGWPVKGLWEIQPVGAEPTAVQRSWGGMLLATGNSAGRLYLVHNPCQSLAGFVGDNGHAGAISQVGWIAGDSAVISIGAKDNAIFQWKCVYDVSRESGDEGGLSCDDSEIERDCGHEEVAVSAKQTLMTQQPWLANIAPPALVSDDVITTPPVQVDPDFIHGIRSGDCRQSLRYNCDGNIVFFACRMGIIYDRAQHVQRIYDHHNAAIISIDIGVKGKIVASGELCDNPDLHIWDAKTAAKLFVVSDIHRNGISGLSFSPSGKWLASLGQDTMNSIVLIRSPSARWLGDVYVHSSVNISLSKMFWIKHLDNDSAEYPIIVGGNRLIYFFRAVGKTLVKSRGTFGRRRKLQSILCITEAEVVLGSGSAPSMQVVAGKEPDESPGSHALTVALLTGTVTGHIYVWKNQRVASTLTAHDAPVFCVAALKASAGGGFLTGGKDGLIKVWSPGLKLIYSYNSQTFTPSPFNLSVHSLAVNDISNKLAIVMRSGEIYEVTLSTHSTMLLLESHSYKELHGLCTNPINADEYATVGDDGVVRVWSISSRKCIRRAFLEVAGRAVCWSPDGLHIAVGIGGDPAMNSKDGAIMILNANTLDVLFEDRKAKFTISEIKFSPSGAILVVASRDGKIYIHDCQKDANAQQYKLLSCMEMPIKETFVTHVDFNNSSTIVRFSTNSNDLLNFALNEYPYNNVTLIPLAATTRNELWATSHVPFAWMTKGVWRPPSDGVDVCATDVIAQGSRGGPSLVVAAYENAELGIFNYPCQNFGCAPVAVKGLSSHAPAIRISANGKYLVALDARARTVLQYKISWSSR